MGDTDLRISQKDAESIILDEFGFVATCMAMDGYDDQNFAVIVDEEPQYALKVSADPDKLDRWEFEDRVTTHLSSLDYQPYVRVPKTSGSPCARGVTVRGTLYVVRLTSFLAGTPLTNVRYRSPSLLQRVGRAAGKLDVGLMALNDPQGDHKIEWDIRHAYELLPFTNSIADGRDRVLVETTLSTFEKTRNLVDGDLPISLIHNDLNDANILYDRDHPTLGIIDFGDMVRTYTVVEPAVALAYLLMDQNDPILSACHFISGYCEIRPLSETEATYLFDFILARLCLSVIMSARQKTDDAFTPYQVSSESSAWKLLHHLTSLQKEVSVAALRAAAGYPVYPNHHSVTSFLSDSQAHSFPLELTKGDTCFPIDFSVDSTVFDASERVDPAEDGRRIDALLSENNATCGVGYYNEPRLCYAADQYRVNGQANRTIHLGIDLFKPAGTVVQSVFDGTIHSVATFEADLDYGTVIIIRHKTPDGEIFYSLYGHLAPVSHEFPAVGDSVSAGEAIGVLGAPQENGGWVPHLHFQIMLDLFGFDNTFPGVASPDHRKLWTSMCPDPNILFNLDASFKNVPLSTLLDRRSRHLPSNLSLSYDEPLIIVKGIGQYLYDSEGRQFLDCVNNVCHVGHCNPRVVEATVAQLRTLNTNTRYLHNNILEYAERLTATFPDPLDVCFLVNSGSEANDLALRLATAATSRRHVLALKAAYHGNLDALIDISSYKFEGPGGRQVKDHLILADLPDTYRGKYSGNDAGSNYAADVGRLLASSGEKLAAFIAESLPGCGGQIVLPENYLQELYLIVRANGGVCIADEVQVGFGRVGHEFWGFQLQKVVPDIVTLGKPIGNGHPIGAVVTTREIADTFANGMEYFNTFGGNPVSCAAGLAVLDVLEEEHLQEHAQAVGEYLMRRLESLKGKYSLIGDVRGRGLFIGVELVEDLQTLKPAAWQSAYLVNRMRNKGILLSIDGPLHNVIKIKPPMVFDTDNANLLVESLDTVLSELENTTTPL